MLLVLEAHVCRVPIMPDAVDWVGRAFANQACSCAIDVSRERTQTTLGGLNILYGAAPQAGMTGLLCVPFAARVYAGTRDKLRAFCADILAKLGIEVESADSAADDVRGADIVDVITRSAVPVAAGAWLAPGQHVKRPAATG